MKYFLTTDRAVGQFMIDTMDKTFGYPNGNAYTYATLILPVSASENRVAVPIEDRCLSVLNSNDVSQLVDALPASFVPVL